MKSYPKSYSHKFTNIINRTRLLVPVFIFALAFLVRIPAMNLVGQLDSEKQTIRNGAILYHELSQKKFTGIWANMPLIPNIAYGIVSRMDIISQPTADQIIFNYDWGYSRLFSIFISSLTAVSIYLLGCHLMDKKLGFFMALIFSFNPTLIHIGQTVNSTNLVLLFLSSLMFLTTQKYTSQNKKLSLLTIFTLLCLLLSLTYINLLNQNLETLVKGFPKLISPILLSLIANPLYLLVLTSLGMYFWQLKNSSLRLWTYGFIVVCLLLSITELSGVYLNYIYSLFAGVALRHLYKHNLFRQNYLPLVGLLVILVIYPISQTHPYYSDYYNILVGGTSGVYKNQIAAFGSNGQGLRQAGIWLINNLDSKSTIGTIIKPTQTLPPIDDAQVFSYDKDKSYDYLVISSAALVANKFNLTSVYATYEPAYQVQVANAPIVTVFKNKSLTLTKPSLPVE